jgi:hypothetical protein
MDFFHVVFVFFSIGNNKLIEDEGQTLGNSSVPSELGIFVVF